MMRGYDGVFAVRPATPKRYRVVRSEAGWRVEVNGCFTGPIPDRKVATHLARKLQQESNHLSHHRAGKTVQ
jgi:hypothetical protein